jgi:predicted nucleotidyltransferase
MMRTLLSRLEEELATWEIQPIYASLFGSGARGTMKPHSDLDLFFVRPDRLNEEELSLWDEQLRQLIEKVTSWTGNDTRPIQVAEHQVLPGNPLLDNIRDDALTIAGTRAWLERKLRRTRANPA